MKMKWDIDGLKARAASAVPFLSTRYLPLQLSFILAIILGISGFKVGDHIFSNKAEASIARMQDSNIEDWSQAERAKRAKNLRMIALRAPEKIGEFSMQDIVVLFSEPALVRTEGDARHWQYRSSLCLLDIFVAAVPEAGRSPILHYEFRPRRTARLVGDDAVDMDAPDQRACIESLAFRT